MIGRSTLFLATLALCRAASITIPGIDLPALPCTLNCLIPGDPTTVGIYAGLPRTYLSHIPASYDGTKPVPLLIDLHGILSYSGEQRGQSGQLQESDARGFIAVWPQGLGTSWNGYGCCDPSYLANVDDVGFIRQIIQEMKGKAYIDPTRVFVTGISNGGLMAQRLACEAADLIRAVVALSAPLNTNAQQCQPSRPLTVFEIACTADTVVPYDGKNASYGLPTNTGLGPVISGQGAIDSMNTWGGILGCSGSAGWSNIVTDQAYMNKYATCGGGVTTGLVTIVGGQHVMYMGATGLGTNQTDIPPINVATWMWDNVFGQF